MNTAENKIITISEAHYLKHSGEEIDVKVTIKIIDGSPVIYMRDFEFFSFTDALSFLRYIVETELCGSPAEARP